MRTAHLTLFLCLLARGRLALPRPLPGPGLRARRRARAQVLPLAARPLARGDAEVARRRDRRRLRPRDAPSRCSRSSRSPSTHGSCAGSGATFDQDSFTPFGLLAQAGAPERVARVVALAIGSPSSRSPGGGRASCSSSPRRCCSRRSSGSTTTRCSPSPSRSCSRACRSRLAPAAPHVGHHLGRGRRRARRDVAPDARDLRGGHRFGRPRARGMRSRPRATEVQTAARSFLSGRDLTAQRR